MKLIDQYIDKMRKERLPEEAIRSFAHYFAGLSSGDTGLIPESHIEPVPKESIDSLDKIDNCENTAHNKDLLSKTVCIKLNGGLGTTMGLQEPKSLIPVKNGLTFLDITCRQIVAFNRHHDVKIPLILMNSFRTEAESLKAVGAYAELATEIPGSFLQHKFPKVMASNLEPATFSDDPEMEWNPPGHGDIYIALETSGILDKLIKGNYRYAFISNIDNLGASLDLRILSYISRNSIPFLMEVTDRTFMDRKGGHLARLDKSHLLLREAAQCPDESAQEFQNIDKYCFFNTNNLWIDIHALKAALDKSNGFLNLPMIRNRKKLNPVDKESADVYQVESAMGTAISVFDNAAALRVPRSRFAPVKNCEDLLLLWSDSFIIDDDSNIIPNPKRKFDTINIMLDPEYYSFINKLTERFPNGAPSLIHCKSLSIKGDFIFGKKIVISDTVTLVNKSGTVVTIDDNSIIDSDQEIN